MILLDAHSHDRQDHEWKRVPMLDHLTPTTQEQSGIHLSAPLLRGADLRFPIGLCSMHAPALTWIPLYIGALLFAMQEVVRISQVKRQLWLTSSNNMSY